MTLIAIDGGGTLLPSRAEAYARLGHLLDVAPVVGVGAGSGFGRSLLVRKVAEERGGALFDGDNFIEMMRSYQTERWEEAVRDEFERALDRTDLLIIDDFVYFSGLLGGNSARPGYFWNVIVAILREAVVERGKQLLLVGSPAEIWSAPADLFGHQALTVELPPFTAQDYARYFELMLGERVAGVDFALVHRLAPFLDGYQLRLACNLLSGCDAIDTDTVIDLFEKRILKSSIRTSEVEALSFDSLPGAEHIAEALETHVILPFEQKALAKQYNVRPHRGVLLYGPPGTGKTSVGRALAHRIKGRFFLLDGRSPTEPPWMFFAALNGIVAEAKRNAPSVLFIDDADVLFEIEHIAGLSRYLLSLLDGLESATAGNVCVMMTAMDPKKLPDALLRSGRVELWLETRLPDDATRARILERWMADDLPEAGNTDFAALAALTPGFTPADLRRLTGDAKLLYSVDIARGAKPHKAQTYLEQAIADLVDLRTAMADHLADESLRLGLAGSTTHEFA